ncbi:MAG: hypothetical protein Q8942_02955 [Bacillota bacterium]|nr:hypothetical protein [Bacillota bacterium]
MSCEKYSPLIMKYFDGNIADTDKDSLLEHLNICHVCSEEFNSLKEIFNCLEEDDKDSIVEPPLNFEASVMDKVRLYEEQRRKKIERLLIIIYGTSFAILGVISVLAVIYFRSTGGLSHISKDQGLSDIFWGIVFFVYSAVKNISLIFKDSLSSYGNYYIFVFGLIIYLIIQKSIVKNEDNAQNS